MNNDADKDNLLAEVLAEATPADFRPAMLAETLRLARRRRQFRQAQRGVGVLAILSLLAIFVTNALTKKTIVLPAIAKKSTIPGYNLVSTQPMPAGSLIATEKFPSSGFAGSVPNVMEITTVIGDFRLINDNELLALLADKPAALIRIGPRSEELVFANPEDQKKFRVY